MECEICIETHVAVMQEADRARGAREAHLTLELQTFPHAVLYQQAAAGSGSGAAAIGNSIRPSVSGLVVLNDPEVWQSVLAMGSHTAEARRRLLEGTFRMYQIRF